MDFQTLTVRRRRGFEYHLRRISLGIGQVGHARNTDHDARVLLEQKKKKMFTYK